MFNPRENSCPAKGGSAAAATELRAPAPDPRSQLRIYESSGERSSFRLSSNDDDRDQRTRAEGTKATRRGQAHRCGRRHRDLPDPARSRERLPGRLAVVFLDRLFAGFPGQHWRQGRGLFRRFHGDRRHPLAERIVRGAIFPAAIDPDCYRLRVEPSGPRAARPALAHTRSTAVARPCRGRRRCARRAGRSERGRQLERPAAISLSRAIWRGRSALQQGHRLLSVLATRLYRDQKLDAARRWPVFCSR